MSPILCRLTSALPDGARRAPITRAHARSCLKCQAVGARERTLHRHLEGLGSEIVPAPPYLAATVMARLGDQGGPVKSRLLATAAARRAAAGVGVGAAAAAALITGMALRKSRAV